MASSPLALVARVVSAFREERAMIIPPGYKAPEPMTAEDYLAPVARWPLVWVMNIGGWSEDPTTRQVSFTLTHGAKYRNEAAQFTARMPFDAGDLFDKRGAYVVVALPVADPPRVNAALAAAAARVNAILAAARRA